MLDARFAGRLVRFECAGGTDDVVRTPFAHALVDEVASHERPTMSVFVWDSASTGAPVPITGLPGVTDLDGESYSFEDGRRRFRWWPSSRLLMAHDTVTSDGWWWIDDARVTPWHERAARSVRSSTGGPSKRA